MAVLWGFSSWLAALYSLTNRWYCNFSSIRSLVYNTHTWLQLTQSRMLIATTQIAQIPLTTQVGLVSPPNSSTRRPDLHHQAPRMRHWNKRLLNGRSGPLLVLWFDWCIFIIPIVYWLNQNQSTTRQHYSIFDGMEFSQPFIGAWWTLRFTNSFNMLIA